jgi:hypothetical protein
MFYAIQFSFWICSLYFLEHPEQTRTEQTIVRFVFVSNRTSWDLRLFGSKRTRTEQGVCSVLQLSNNDFVRFGLEPNKPNKLEPALFGKPTLRTLTSFPSSLTFTPPSDIHLKIDCIIRPFRPHIPKRHCNPLSYQKISALRDHQCVSIPS